MTGATSRQEDRDCSDTQSQKLALRLSMNAIRDSLSPATRQAAALRVAEKVRDSALDALLPEPEGTIALYIAIRSEISCAPLMEVLAEMGYRLALPRLNGGHMSFHRYRYGDRLREGPLRTREPHEEAEVVIPDLVITPLLAFDRDGRRLGYGMGYYDRYFGEHPGVPRVGLAYACQEVARVPTAAHDTPLTSVLTEA